MVKDMVIMSRTFELLNWLLPKAEGFPRSYRYTLTRHIVDRTLDFNECLVAAQSGRGDERWTALQQADDHLQALRIYLRLIHGWRWLNDPRNRSWTAFKVRSAWCLARLNEAE